jgi:hypothetical protein
MEQEKSDERACAQHALGDPHGPLRALARKYDVLHALRVQNTPDDVPREQLAALARVFPGALRALDMLPMATLAARRDELALTLAEGHAASPWMEAELAYCGTMRAVLRIRSLLRVQTDGASLPVDAAALGYRAEEGEPCAASFDQLALATIAAPPDGRLEGWVRARVAAALHITVEALVVLLEPWRVAGRG